MLRILRKLRVTQNSFSAESERYFTQHAEVLGSG